MTDIAFSMTADDKDVIRGLKAIQNESGNLRDKINEIMVASRQAGAADSQLAQMRMKSLNELLPKQRELKVAGDELNRQLKEGKISATEHAAGFANIANKSNELKVKLQQLRAQLNEDTDDMRQAGLIADRTADKFDHFRKAVASLDRQKEKGLITSKQYQAELTREQAKLSESTDGVSEKTGAFTGKLTALTAAGVGSVGIIQQMAAKLKELHSEMTSDIEAFDKMSRKLQIQGSLTDAQRKDQSRHVGKVAFDAAVPIEKAFETATQLNSSGFADPVKGGSLNTALALMQSSNQIDGDAASFIKGSGQFMQAFGMQKNEQNLADLGIRMQGLFKSTDVQAGDLPDFAKAAPVLSGAGLTLEQSLSTLTALRETMNAGEASTGARNVVLKLQTAKAVGPAREGLASIGLKPEDVDIQGEGLKAALERLKAATAKLGEAERAQALTSIFGAENSPAASILMNSTGKFDRYAQMQREAAPTFIADVNTARSGSYATEVRANVQKQMDSVKLEDETTQQELMRKARVSLREQQSKQWAANGTVMGKLHAAANEVIRAPVDDYLRYPLTGESYMGAGHGHEMERLSNTGPNASRLKINLPPGLQNGLNGNPGIAPRPFVPDPNAIPGKVPVQVVMPKELTEALKANADAAKRNAEALERLEAKTDRNAHAGNVAARAADNGRP